MPMVATAGDRHTGEGAEASGGLLGGDPAEDIFPSTAVSSRMRKIQT